MDRMPDLYRKYNSAHDRFLKPAIVNFFKRECPKYFGPAVREMLAEELIGIFFSMNRELNTIGHGQLLWNALDKNTRADSPKRRYVPVVLTLVNEQDIQARIEAKPLRDIMGNTIERLCQEAYQQGGILSMRDIALIMQRADSRISTIRMRYEEINKVSMPHTGSLHDMGSCISHKKQIVRKVIIERKDPTTVARETAHSQKAVDRYLQDYHRVNTVIKNNDNLEYIHLVTGIAKHVVKQYIEIIEEYEKMELI